MDPGRLRLTIAAERKNLVFIGYPKQEKQDPKGIGSQ